MDEMGIIALLITAILGVLSGYYSVKYMQVKGALKEIVDALEDDEISKEEFVKIVLSIKRILY